MLAENQCLKATIVDMEVRFSELLNKSVDKEWCSKVSLAENQNEKKYIIFNQFCRLLARSFNDDDVGYLRKKKIRVPSIDRTSDLPYRS